MALDNNTFLNGTALDDVYPFGADIEASSNGTPAGNDSVLIDLQSLESGTINFGDFDRSSVNVGSELAVQDSALFADGSESYKPNHGSIYDDTRSKSKSTSELGNTSITRNETWETLQRSQTLYYPVDMSEPKMPHKYSAWADSTEQYALQQWLEKPERHERIACQLEQSPSSRASPTRTSTIRATKSQLSASRSTKKPN